ncbi:bifunctional biotin--[acetyl-CoA-carboxylase] ligase/biotin operon repressor BirA [Stutzerimonas zhaodongensis]|uniref:bifunctional biotin--[acetyl-CoA-carboxylase] ligase/biotin operon repressor BirA n=1 Tax=Stutzerimonas TaxID=2901164 RepID=UPI00388DE17F
MNNLLRLLSDGRFHSGEELGSVLGVSRSAVWKNLKRFEAEFGIELFRVPGKGYRLAEPLSLINHEESAAALADLGWTLYVLDTVDSTNAEAFRLIDAGVTTPFVIVSEAQTAGRGRRGRAWVSPSAQNIYYTLALKITRGPSALSALSLVVGLAVLKALRLAGVSNAGLKWPNDVLADGKKIAGILVELSGDPADVCHVIIGIGVNVNMAPGSLDVGQPWTSVKEQVGGLCDRGKFLQLISRSLSEYLSRHAREGFAALHEEWEANNIWRGKQCTLSTGSQQFTGMMMGVDQQGALRLRISDQEQRSFSGGELSLRLNHDS